MFWSSARFIGFFLDRPGLSPRQSPTLCRFFFLGAVTDTFASALPFLARQLYFLFLSFQSRMRDCPGISGLISIGFGGHDGLPGVFFYVLANNGVVGNFNLRRPIRLLVFRRQWFRTLGGFRIGLCYHVDDFLLLFYLEGLNAFRYVVGLILTAITAMALILPVCQ